VTISQQQRSASGRNENNIWPCWSGALTTKPSPIPVGRSFAEWANCPYHPVFATTPSSVQAGEIEFAFMAISAHSFGVMSDRELILDVVQEMPPSASFSEIMDELMLLATVRERLGKNPQGAGVPAEELLKQVSSWATK